MKATKRLRVLLGISQKEMAEYLSVTRSQLTMYENGNRDLPVAALLKLAAIEIYCNEPVANTTGIHPQITAQVIKAKQHLENYAKEQEYKQALAERNLKAVENVYAQKLLLLNLVGYLKNIDETKAPDTWLNMMEMKALAGINESGLHIQAIQQVRISGIRQECKQAVLLKKRILKEKSIKI